MAESQGNNDKDVELEGWNPQAALNALTCERTVGVEETEEDISRRLFRENLPMATLAITHLAQHAPNERVRLDAAKYVVERNLGRIQDANPFSTEDPFERLLAEVVRESNLGN